MWSNLSGCVYGYTCLCSLVSIPDPAFRGGDAITSLPRWNLCRLLAKHNHPFSCLPIAYRVTTSFEACAYHPQI